MPPSTSSSDDRRPLNRVVTTLKIYDDITKLNWSILLLPTADGQNRSITWPLTGRGLALSGGVDALQESIRIALPSVPMASDWDSDTSATHPTGPNWTNLLSNYNAKYRMNDAETVYNVAFNADATRDDPHPMDMFDLNYVVTRAQEHMDDMEQSGMIMRVTAYSRNVGQQGGDAAHRELQREATATATAKWSRTFHIRRAWAEDLNLASWWLSCI